MKGISGLRDLQFGEPFEYPTVNVDVNRERAGQLGVTTAEIGRAVVAATYSTRFIKPVYWADPRTGVGYQVQVQVPQARMSSLQDIENIPIMRHHPRNHRHARREFFNTDFSAHLLIRLASKDPIPQWEDPK